MTAAEGADFWVFGYGSLMWRPGFAYAARRKAVLRGWRRRLCIYSHHYRGTPERPGLVLGLDQGGSCAGVAFQIEATSRVSTIRYLRERELVTNVYLERKVRVALDDSIEVEALTYVADRSHEQYAGALPRERALELVRGARGTSGDNVAYVLATRDHLRELGIHDADLEWLGDRLS